MKKGIGQEKERKEKEKKENRKKNYVCEENKIVARAREGEGIRTVQKSCQSCLSEEMMIAT